jgi:hypothetical protein
MQQQNFGVCNMTMRVWNVVQNGQLKDTVFYDDSLDADYVLRSLINHDGYPNDITVEPGHLIHTADDES